MNVRHSPRFGSEQGIRKLRLEPSCPPVRHRVEWRILNWFLNGVWYRVRPNLFYRVNREIRWANLSDNIDDNLVNFGIIIRSVSE